MPEFVPVDAKGFANLILDWALHDNIDISPMKLQKLSYYCHAEFLLETKIPLIAQEFEAWDYGPVIPSLFQEFKQFGSEGISGRAFRFDPVSATREVAKIPDLGGHLPMVRSSFDLYVRFSAGRLSRMSHISDGPWSEALRRFSQGQNAGRRISNELILAHHRARQEDSVH